MGQKNSKRLFERELDATRRAPKRPAAAWETVSFKVLPEMKKRIAADMVVTECHTEAEYFRFLLRQRFERVK